MPDLAIAHFGTTLIEQAPVDGEDQASIALTGDLERTDRFLRILGMEVYVSNMYPGVGRQYIYRKGEFSDPDYFEKDSFTSYSAQPLTEVSGPRVGDAIFRLPHLEPIVIAKTLSAEKLITPISSLEDFLSGKQTSLLFTGPDKQQYELCASQATRQENHRIYIWTDPADLEAHCAGYFAHFDIAASGTEDFYGIATAHILTRAEPGITIALLTLREGSLTPKHSFDIFKDAGYSHFRLAAPNKENVKAIATEAFPDGGGDVSYVHFQNAYLELVQI